MDGALPRFDFSGCSFASDEELAKGLDNLGKGSKFFEPGDYELTVDEVEFKGANKNDGTWYDFTVTLKGADGEKSIKDFISVPTKDVKFGEKGSLYPFKKVKEFCAALGVELTVPTLKEGLQSVFAKTDKLKGQVVGTKVGYQGAYSKYTGKDESGEALFALVLRDGNVAHDEKTKQPLSFKGREAVEAYATQNKINYSGFTRVLNYSKSASGAGLAQDAGW